MELPIGRTARIDVFSLTLKTHNGSLNEQLKKCKSLLLLRKVITMDFAQTTGGASVRRDRRTDDPARPWFLAYEELGDHIGIRFGRIAPGGLEPEWFYRSHADFDGIGGLTDILRGRGAEVTNLPKAKYDVKQSLKSLVNSLGIYVRPKKLISWARRFPSARPATPSSPPEAVAWRVFDRETTAAIRQTCHDAGYTVNSFLLKHLSDAIFPHLSPEEPNMPWMVPVNLRGKVARERDTANHVSFVRVLVDRTETPEALHAKIYKCLTDGDHWANLNSYKGTRFLSIPARKKIITEHKATSQWLIGAFSNLGEWDAEGSYQGEGIDGDWLFSPPAICFFPIGAGCVTWRGRMALTLQMHSEISNDPADAESWVRDWVANIEADLAARRKAHDGD